MRRDSGEAPAQGPSSEHGTGPAPDDASTGGSVASINPWVIMGAILAGTYLPVVSLTVLGVALPDISEEFGASTYLSTEWVVTIYVAAVTVILPATGWLGDRFGRRPAYLAALASFGIGSVFCALAPTFLFLVGGRVLQGLGGGILQPIAMATIYELFPPDKRGTALGMWGVAVMAAPALGPPLGGLIVTRWGWRWIFVAMIGLAIIALVLAWFLLRETSQRDERPLDGRGWALAAIGVVTLVVVSRKAQEWGFFSPTTLAAAALALAALAVLVWRSRRLESPILDLSMFSVPVFSATMLVIWLMTISQFARLNYLPVELQVVHGMDAQQVGLLLMPAAVGVAITMPIGGRLADRVGPRLPVTLGIGSVTLTTFGLANLTPTTPFRVIVGLLIAQGIATGLAIMPTTISAMNSLPTRFVAQASSVISLNRQLAGAVGTAMMGAVIVFQLGAIAPEGLTTTAEIQQAQNGYNRMFLVTALLLAVTTVLAFFLPGKQRTREFQQERAKEQAEIFGHTSEAPEQADEEPGQTDEEPRQTEEVPGQADEEPVHRTPSDDGQKQAADGESAPSRPEARS